MAARIQFSRGIDESVAPNVRVTRSRDGSNGTATFYFQNPAVLAQESNQEITGMYLIDEEGELCTREVKARFVNGQPEAIEAVYLMKSADEFDRFIRFMNRYAEDNGLGLNQS